MKPGSQSGTYTAHISLNVIHFWMASSCRSCWASDLSPSLLSLSICESLHTLIWAIRLPIIWLLLQVRFSIRFFLAPQILPKSFGQFFCRRFGFLRCGSRYCIGCLVCHCSFLLFVHPSNGWLWLIRMLVASPIPSIAPNVCICRQRNR